jgi:hypothetical protein
MKIIVMVEKFFATRFTDIILLFSDYFSAAAAGRGRPPSASSLAPGYDLSGTTLKLSNKCIG